MPTRAKTFHLLDDSGQLEILSASPTDAPTHSGAGRIVTIRMRLMSLAERAIEQPSVRMADLLTGERLPLTGSSAGPLLGALFESLVTLSVRPYAQANEARVSHLRTRGGEHEIDLIIERGDGRVVALEVKPAAPRCHDIASDKNHTQPEKHLLRAIESL